MSELTGPIHIVGTGLIGTSLGLAARRAGLTVWLSDESSEHRRIATSLGAGDPLPPGAKPQLVVVAVPPLSTADAIVAALATGAVVTDVASVKGLPLAQVSERVGREVLWRYVGGHPMAGSERSGPLAGNPDIFDGRPWAVTPHAHADPDAVDLVERLARICGAVPVRLTPVEHDHAVARTSHLPHLLAVLAAGQLLDAVPEHLTLSGPGVRDVTRVAAGDPDLYAQIIRANGEAVHELLVELRKQLDVVIEAVDGETGDDLVKVLTRGADGTRAIPGKHGGPPLSMDSLFVAVPDQPGELARLFVDIGEIGVNVEDLHIDHDPGRPAGLVELIVAAGAAEDLRGALEARNWSTHR